MARGALRQLSIVTAISRHNPSSCAFWRAVHSDTETKVLKFGHPLS